MFKKVVLGFLVILLVLVGVFTVKIVIPLQDGAERFGPEAAALDLALQDDSKIALPTPGCGLSGSAEPQYESILG